jgi:hypothetical protein
MYLDGEFHFKFNGKQRSDEYQVNESKKKHEAEGKTVTLEDFVGEYGTWYDWGFFEVKVFKKGTMHLKFKDEKVWENLNRKYAKIKGQVLPEKI